MTLFLLHEKSEEHFSNSYLRNEKIAPDDLDNSVVSKNSGEKARPESGGKVGKEQEAVDCMIRLASLGQLILFGHSLLLLLWRTHWGRDVGSAKNPSCRHTTTSHPLFLRRA